MRHPSLDVLLEFGRVVRGKIGLRRAGSVSWRGISLEEVVELGVRPEDLDPAWTEQLDLQQAVGMLGYWGGWPELGWMWGTDSLVERAWVEVGDGIVEGLAAVKGWWAKQLKVPVLDERLRITGGAEIRSGEVIAPTETGWQRFLEESLGGGGADGSRGGCHEGARAGGGCGGGARGCDRRGGLLRIASGTVLDLGGALGVGAGPTVGARQYAAAGRAREPALDGGEGARPAARSVWAGVRSTAAIET